MFRYFVLKTDLLTGRRRPVFCSVSLSSCFSFVRSRFELMKVHGFVYDYKVFVLDPKFYL